MLKWFRSVRSGRVEVWDDGSAEYAEVAGAKYHHGRDSDVSDLFEDVTPSAGGGSQLVTEAGYYQGNTVNIENGVTGTVGFDFFTSGDDVLNVTNPLLPLARKAGLFIVSCEVECGTLTAGGSFQAQLILDVSGDGVEIDGTGVAASNFVRNLASVSGQYVLAAGGSLRMDVFSGDGAATRGFSITNALVARIGPA